MQILCRLYRNSTQYKNGKHVRDLSKLNRDLSNVLLITSDPDAFFLQPDNAIKVHQMSLQEVQVQVQQWCCGGTTIRKWQSAQQLCNSNACRAPSDLLLCRPQLEPWKLEAEDTKLLDLMPFLEAVVRTGVPDVRSVIRSYEGEDIPVAFRDRMSRLQSKSKGKRSFLGGLAPSR